MVGTKLNTLPLVTAGSREGLGPSPRSRGVSRGLGRKSWDPPLVTAGFREGWVGNPPAERSAVRINSCFPRYRGVFFQGANSLGCQAHASSFFPSPRVLASMSRNSEWQRTCQKSIVRIRRKHRPQSRSPPLPPQPPKQTHHTYPLFP